MSKKVFKREFTRVVIEDTSLDAQGVGLKAKAMAAFQDTICPLGTSYKTKWSDTITLDETHGTDNRPEIRVFHKAGDGMQVAFIKRALKRANISPLRDGDDFLIRDNANALLTEPFVFD